MMKKKAPPISAVDLFCGAGGLTHGFILEGIKVRAGVDIDPYCKYPFEHNNSSTFIEKSIKNLAANDLRKYYKKGEIKVLAGCAPCQPFSSFTNAYEKKKKELKSGDSAETQHSKNEKWTLLYFFAKLARELEPDIVTMENVPQLVKHSVFDNFVDVLKDMGYTVEYCQNVNCSKYGIPQSRKRLVLFASKKGKITLPSSDGYRSISNSVRASIGNMSRINAGSSHRDDPLHKSKNLSELNLKRIRASKPGGTWEDWNKELLPECYKQDSGKTYKSVYGRMKWDDPSPTITTQFHTYGTGRFGHPEQDRALSLREGAILQTFPKSYSFVADGDPIVISKIGRLIGNAVPVDLGRVIAKAIIKHVERHDWT